MKLTQDQQKTLQPIWLWCIFTTLIYFAFNISGYPMERISSPLGYIAGFVGLFVPYGISSLILLFSLSGLASLGFFILFMYLIERGLRQIDINFYLRILINFLVLLLLTIMVDFIRGTPLESWTIFFNGAFPHYCC
jgi:hypothetical protein